jgi:hypothetical protein
MRTFSCRSTFLYEDAVPKHTVPYLVRQEVFIIIVIFLINFLINLIILESRNIVEGERIFDNFFPRLRLFRLLATRGGGF